MVLGLNKSRITQSMNLNHNKIEISKLYTIRICIIDHHSDDLALTYYHFVYRNLIQLTQLFTI